MVLGRFASRYLAAIKSSGAVALIDMYNPVKHNWLNWGKKEWQPERNTQKNLSWISFITPHQNAYPVSLPCQLLGVKRNDYYQYWKSLKNRPDDLTHQEMLEWIQHLAKNCNYTYDRRRMKTALNVRGYPLSRNQARKLTREVNNLT